MSLARDQTLTVVAHGKEDQVKQARREVMTKLQTQVKLSHIPHTIQFEKCPQLYETINKVA